MSDLAKIDDEMRGKLPQAVAEFHRIQGEINKVVRGMEELVRLMGEGVVCKEHLFCLSAPGLAKSMTAGLVAATMTDGPMFELNFNAHTKPAELNGPTDLSGLKEVPSVLRYNVTEMLPEAHIAVLDEAFKAGSEILNTLLGILNERKFKNGGTVVRVPLQTALIVSNEYPGEDSLAALWDRILYRFHLIDEMDDTTFMEVMEVATAHWAAKLGVPGIPEIAPIPPMSSDLMGVLRYATARMASPAMWSGAARGAWLECRHAFVMSPRRWTQALRAVAARAVTEGATQVMPEHLRVLEHIVWDRHDEKPVMQAALARILATAAIDPLDTYLADMVRIKGEFDGANPNDWNSMLDTMKVALEHMQNHDHSDDRTQRARSLYQQAALANAERHAPVRTSR